MFKSLFTHVFGNGAVPLILLLTILLGMVLFVRHSPIVHSKDDLMRKSRHIGNVQIIERITDYRGLTSVIYVQSGDTFALDYLTQEELNILCNN